MDGFRYYFTPLTGVLFTFPSRYWFTIGQSVVFSLTGWSPRILAGLHVSCDTRVPARSVAVSITGLSPSLAGHSMPFVYHHSPLMQAPRPLETFVSRFRLFPVRSPLLGESMFLSVPPGT